MFDTHAKKIYNNIQLSCYNQAPYFLIEQDFKYITEHTWPHRLCCAQTSFRSASATLAVSVVTTQVLARRETIVCTPRIRLHKV